MVCENWKHHWLIKQLIKDINGFKFCPYCGGKIEVKE